MLTKVLLLDLSPILSGGRVGNMMAWHAVNPGSIPGRGRHTDFDDHYSGSPVSLDPQWYVKNLGDIDKRSSPSKVKLIDQKQDCPSMTLSG